MCGFFAFNPPRSTGPGSDHSELGSVLGRRRRDGRRAAHQAFCGQTNGCGAKTDLLPSRWRRDTPIACHAPCFPRARVCQMSNRTCTVYFEHEFAHHSGGRTGARTFYALIRCSLWLVLRSSCRPRFFGHPRGEPRTAGGCRLRSSWRVRRPDRSLGLVWHTAVLASDSCACSTDAPPSGALRTRLRSLAHIR
jgi:hypothetical protein